MEFGLCTNFAAPAEDPVGLGLLPLIAQAGFDYVELPLCEVAALSPGEFVKLKQAIRESGLTAPTACNLFPDAMILRGGKEKKAEISDYLEHALSRAAELGIEKIVFASVSAWNTEGDQQAAQNEIVTLVQDVMVPVFEKYGIQVLIEGIRKQVCNVVNTLPEAAGIAARVGHPSCGLMADLFHMLSNEEPEEHLSLQRNKITHVHIAELDRKLPVDAVSPELKQLVSCLGNGTYDSRISFEVRAPFTCGDLERAKHNILKEIL